MGVLARIYLKLTPLRSRVISLVRDPIAQRVSSIFQAPDLYGIDIDGQDAATTARIIEKRFSTTDFSYVYNWFSREFKSVYDFDIYDSSFKREDGYERYESEKADILILQLESLSDLIETELSDFVGKDLEVKESNIRSKKKRGNKYEEVKRKVSIDRSTCRSIYDHRWVRYFYTDDQVLSFIDRWSSTS